MTIGNIVSASSFTFGSFDVGLTITATTGTPVNSTLESYINPVQFTMADNAPVTENYIGSSILPETAIEAAVAVSALDDNGQPVSNSISSQVVTLLSSLREINFVVSYLEPSYQNVWINYVVIAQPGANLATVTNSVNAAVTAYLSPANWAGGNQTPPVWDTTVTSIFYLSLASVIESIAGVQSIRVVGGTPSLGLAVYNNPGYGYNDISLQGVIAVALPNLVSVSGTALPGL
jgi:hypothetical protein